MCGVSIKCLILSTSLFGLPLSGVAVFRDLEVGWIQQRLFTIVAKIRPTVYVCSSPYKQQGCTNHIAMSVLMSCQRLYWPKNCLTRNLDCDFGVFASWLPAAMPEPNDGINKLRVQQQMLH